MGVVELEDGPGLQLSLNLEIYFDLHESTVKSRNESMPMNRLLSEPALELHCHGRDTTTSTTFGIESSFTEI